MKENAKRVQGTLHAKYARVYIHDTATEKLLHFFLKWANQPPATQSKANARHAYHCVRGGQRSGPRTCSSTASRRQRAACRACCPGTLCADAEDGWGEASERRANVQPNISVRGGSSQTDVNEANGREIRFFTSKQRNKKQKNIVDILASKCCFRVLQRETRRPQFSAIAGWQSLNPATSLSAPQHSTFPHLNRNVRALGQLRRHRLRILHRLTIRQIRAQQRVALQLIIGRLVAEREPVGLGDRVVPRQLLAKLLAMRG